MKIGGPISNKIVVIGSQKALHQNNNSVIIAAIAMVSNCCNIIYCDGYKPSQQMKIVVQKITITIGLSMAMVSRNRPHSSTYGDGLDNRCRNRCNRPIATLIYGMLAEPLRQVYGNRFFVYYNGITTVTIDLIYGCGSYFEILSLIFEILS